MSDFDYDVFGDESANEPEKVEPPKPVEKAAVTPKKVSSKVVKSEQPADDSSYDVFNEESAPSKDEVKETEQAPASESDAFDVFSDSDSTSSSEDEYYSTNDGGYQDEGGSGNRRTRGTQAGEAASLAVAAVAGAAIANSNKVPKVVKNAINPNAQNKKKQAEEQQFLEARKNRQAKYEQRAKMAAQGVKKPIYKRWWFWLIVGFLLLGIFAASCGDSDSSTDSLTTAVSEEASSTTTTTIRTYSFNELEVKKDEADGNWYAYAGNEKAITYTGFAQNANGLWYVTNGKVDFSKSGSETFNGKEYEIIGGKATEKTTTTKPTTSFSQRNALNTAKDYLDYSAFSRKGLIKQLEYEGYSNSDATWAVDNCGADWNEEAYKSAKQYLSFSSFSHSGLVDQLEYEGFTHEQAEYGVSKTGL